jgi:S-methylmethionine-dependent homocysteine/selenocysteine methylase
MNPSVTVLDGGTGRELSRIGAPFRQPEWSALALIEAPRYVSEVHRSYIAAGADVVTTNSYAVVPFHIGAERFAAEGRDLARLAGRLAREAADAAARPVAVAGSLPPICGSYRAEWFDPVFARPILATLVEGLRPSVDHWQAETLSSTAEAELVRDVLGRDGKPLWLSFTLRDDPAADPSTPTLRSGQSIADAVAVAKRVGAEALLFNCSQPEVMGAAVAAAARIATEDGSAPASLRIGVYANAFAALPKEAEANVEINDIRGDLTPQGYLSWVRQWIDLGASIVGGCCGIGPEHIAAIRNSVELRGSQP